VESKNEVKVARYVNVPLSERWLASYQSYPAITEYTEFNVENGSPRDHGNRSNSSSGVTAAGTAAARGIMLDSPLHDERG